MNFTVYNPTTGQIISSGVCPDGDEDKQALPQLNHGFIGLSVLRESSNYKTDYILNGIKTSKPTLPITIDKVTITADGIDNITLAGAPAGSTITAQGKILGNIATGPCANPDTFSTQIADTYTITISLWPYLDFVTTVTAS